MPDLRISRVRFTPAPPGTAPQGVIGFASCSIADLGRLDGLVVRRAGPERYSIAFPARRDQSGRRHPYFRPRDVRTREAIERAVLDSLRARGMLP